MADDKKQKTLFLDESNLNAGGAPPPSSAPLSGQSTMMLESPAQPPAGQGQRQMVVPTMMKMGPQGDLPPMQQRKRPSTAGRWIAGPLIAALVATGTVFAAGALLPKKGKGGGTAPVSNKPQGKLRLSTDPVGAVIFVDSKRVPRFTPTTVEGDIGSTLKLTFQLEGYKDKEAEVYVAEGEHPFNVKLESNAPAAPPPVATPEPTAKPEHEHHHHTAAPKEPEGKAKISVLVRPWAIVFVDGQKVKQTPISSYEIKSGKHTIELVNENKNRREKIEVNLKPNEESEIKRDWDK